MPVLTEVRSVRFSVEDKRWLQEKATAADRSEGYVVRQLVKQARLADGETTRAQEETDEN